MANLEKKSVLLLLASQVNEDDSKYRVCISFILFSIKLRIEILFDFNLIEQVYNGIPDWVYEEEVLGTNKAMYFSKR